MNIDKDGDEQPLELLYNAASDYVNDTDYMWEYNTPELFGAAVVRRIEKMCNCKLTPDQVDYVMEQASYSDFDVFEGKD